MKVEVPLRAPAQHRVARELGAVVEFQCLGKRPVFGDPRQNANYALACEREIRFDPNAFAREVVDDRKHAKLTSGAQRVVNEVERPPFVRTLHRHDGVSANVTNAALSARSQLQAMRDRSDSRVCG